MPKNLSFIILQLLLLMCLNAKSQNLVLNGSFEENIECPNLHRGFSTVHKKVYAVNWYNPNTATPDYFHRCGSRKCRVPKNSAGYAEAVHGDAYMAIILKSSTKNYREYASGTLSKPLDKGTGYCVKFFVRNALKSPFYSDKIGVYISSELETRNSRFRLKVEPQISYSGDLIKEHFWTQVCGEFIAEGNEKFITIGNFEIDDSTAFKYVYDEKGLSGELGRNSYYLIDDVSLTQIDPDEDCECNENLFKKMFYSDTNEVISVYSGELLMLDNESSREMLSPYRNIVGEYKNIHVKVEVTKSPKTNLDFEKIEKQYWRYFYQSTKDSSRISYDVLVNDSLNTRAQLNIELMVK